MVTARTASELGQYVKKGESEIVVEGDLVNHVYRIKVVGKLAWAVCGVALGAAIYFAMATPAATVATAPAAGAGGVVSFGASVSTAAAAVTVLGVPATVAAVTIGVAAGGIGGIMSLRDKYRIAERNGSRMVLKRA
jgi:hypothetical protein